MSRAHLVVLALLGLLIAPIAATAQSDDLESLRRENRRLRLQLEQARAENRALREQLNARRPQLGPFQPNLPLVPRSLPPELAPGPVPESWQQREYNGIRYYIVPLDERDAGRGR